MPLRRKFGEGYAFSWLPVGDNIPPGKTGAVHVTGVFAFKRADTEDIAMGEEVYLTEEGVTAQAEGETAVKVGYVASPSNGDTVYVKINA